MTNVRGSKARVERKTVVSDVEFHEMMRQADHIPDEFLRLRARALLCLIRITGKRRGELAQLELSDFKHEEGGLNVTFTLEKKRKETVITRRATKTILSSDPLLEPILEYLEYLGSMTPAPRYFLPRAKRVFGSGLLILPDAHITGRQVFNIVRGLSDDVWPHLFRETAASDVIKRDPTIIGAFRVKKRLDLESIQTGFRYLERFATDIIEREVEKDEV